MIKTIIVLIGGIWCIAASWFDLDLFFESRKARFFVNLFGRNGARIFYGALGVFISVIGLMLMIYA